MWIWDQHRSWNQCCTVPWPDIWMAPNAPKDQVRSYNQSVPSPILTDGWFWQETRTEPITSPLPSHSPRTQPSDLEDNGMSSPYTTLHCTLPFSTQPCPVYTLVDTVLHYTTLYNLEISLHYSLPSQWLPVSPLLPAVLLYYCLIYYYITALYTTILLPDIPLN